MTSKDAPEHSEGNVEPKEEKFINILLLGETGVGKSTAINSIANYLTYGDFKEAEKGNLLTLIPSKCVVKDKFGEFHIIEVGDKDRNECLDTGMSATQGVKSYVFPIQKGKLMLRLIDTPGIGDVRGIDQDNENCDNILGYIGQLKELHAICYLFQPTNPRITIFFDYCMTQILSRLDKSASDNIIFIFTNTRGTDYGPGETLLSLHKVIDGIRARSPHVNIRMNKNVFCFDNEAFRYLAAMQKNIQFDPAIKQRNRQSWKRSFEACSKLIKYIVGDEKNPPLKPHFVQSTKAVNEARRVIVQLSHPLAEIFQLITDNLLTLDRHKNYLEMHSNTLDELKKKLYMPVIDLEVTKLSAPVTICASTKCSEIYKVGDINKWHYRQRCHDPCYLKNVPKELIGSPKLLDCEVIHWETGACSECQCDFSAHMHVYYMTRTVDSTVIDTNVQQNVDDRQKVLDEVVQLIVNIGERKEELEQEHNTIVRTCAKFAEFLKKNAITPFSDSCREYIEYMITCERSLGALANESVVTHLQKLLQEYEATRKSFDEVDLLPADSDRTQLLITPEKVQESIQELYKLKHNGDKIRELYECQEKSRKEEHEYTEYVHKVLSEFGNDWNKKGQQPGRNGPSRSNNAFQQRGVGNQRNNTTHATGGHFSPSTDNNQPGNRDY